MSRLSFSQKLSAVEESVDAPAAAGTPGAGRLVQILDRTIRWLIAGAAFFVPFIALPFTADALFVKGVLIEGIAVLLTVAWLLRSLAIKRLHYKRMPLNAAMLASAVLLLASSLLSASPWNGFWGNDPTGEKVATFLSLFAITFIAAAVLDMGDVRRTVSALLGAFGLVGVVSAVQMVAGAAGITLPAWLVLQPVGTANALALVFGIGFVSSSLLALTAITSAGQQLLTRRTHVGAGVVASLLFLVLLFRGFPAMWWGIALTFIVVFAANLTRTWRPAGPRAALATGEHALSSGASAVLFAIVTIALFLAVKPPAFLGQVFPTPVEISPSPSATLTIDWRVIRHHPLFGLGPAGFRFAFNQFRDSALNATAFWQLRFTHGFSFLSTLPATVGLLGTLLFLALVVSAVGLVVRALASARTSDPYRWAVSVGAVFTIAEWFLYASNLTASFLLFLCLGLLAALVREAPPAVGTAPSWWRITRRTLTLDAPSMNFLMSLVTVFAAAFSLISLYAIGSAYAAEVYFRRGIEALNRYGNTNTAEIFLTQAIQLNPHESSYYFGAAQAALVAVNRIIGQATQAPTAELSNQFRSEFSAGINAANVLTALAPEDPQSWVTLGSLYETVIPFLSGADRAAVGAYERARRTDPIDPALPLAQARALVSLADTASLQASQTSGAERSRLDGVAKDALNRAHSGLDAAVSLKSDFAAAHFLSAQVSLRQGNIPEAIRRAEAAAAAAPGDIGVAFQLGFLYYRTGDFNHAAGEFRRAIALNDNYSNARYFLGLIYDRRGDRDGALSQFVKIAAVNPDNDEVRRIITNLRSGRRALEEIAPPPEARTEAPVAEGDAGVNRRRGR